MAIVPQIPATNVDLSADGGKTLTLPWRRFMQYLGTIQGGSITPADIAALTALANEALTDAQDAQTTADHALTVAEAASAPALDVISLLGIAGNDQDSLELAAVSSSLANVSTSLGNVSTSLTGVSSSLGAVSSSLANVSSSLGNVSASVSTQSTSLSQVSASLSGVTSSLANVSTSLTGVSSSLGGVSTSLAAVSTSLATITTPVLFAALPGSPADGWRAFITDGAATTFNTAAAGGGVNHVPVFYDSTLAGWRYG